MKCHPFNNGLKSNYRAFFSKLIRRPFSSSSGFPFPAATTDARIIQIIASLFARLLFDYSRRAVELKGSLTKQNPSNNSISSSRLCWERQSEIQDLKPGLPFPPLPTFYYRLRLISFFRIFNAVNSHSTPTRKL